MLGETLLSRYKIYHRLGSGGFGDTYLAEDLALPGHPQCVVKYLCPKETDPKVIEVAKKLFEREAEVLYRLSQMDPFPSLYAHFEQDDNFFLVQEYIPGHDLTDELIQDNPLPEEQTRQLLLEILAGLEQLHQQNIIHRDLKPPNLRRRVSDDKIMLIDFGAVKEIQHLTVSGTGESAVSVVVGSPGYMPAEQVAGKPKRSSDIYAVGMIGIQAMTGIPPAQLPENTETGELVWRDRTQVSPGFADILDKMVHPYHMHRYQNATEAIAAIASVSPSLQQGNTVPVEFGSVKTQVRGTSTASNNREPWNVGRWLTTGLRPSLKVIIPGFLAMVGVAGVGVALMPNISPFVTTSSRSKRWRGQSPVAFVEAYYDGINRRQFSKTWRKLSPEQQERGGGWKSYLEWWSQVEAVYFEELELSNESEKSATVQVKLWYVMKDGEARKEVKNQIELIWNDPSYGWLINQVSLSEEA